MIFDTLVADFVGEIRRWDKSANIELCVISFASSRRLVDNPEFFRGQPLVDRFEALVLEQSLTEFL
jgi:hypothetical protein